MTPTPELSIVIPCYNEAESLPELLERFARVLPGRNIELVLVDNGSRDSSADVLRRELARPDRRFARSVTVDINQGYGFGIWTGLMAARGDCLAWTHADLQCDPVDVLKAYDLWTSSRNRDRVMVKGSRRERPLAPSLLTFGMQTFAQFFLWQPHRDINAQPKIFPRTLLERMTAPPKDLSLDLYLLHRALRCGWRIRTLPVHFGKRRHGQSRWAFNFFSKWKHIRASILYMARLGRGHA